MREYIEQSLKSNKLPIDANKRIRERNYWLNQLSGELVKSSFPFDNKKKGESKPVLEAVTVAFSQDLFSRLMRLSNKSDIRLFIILMTGVVLLIDKYTGNKDIIVGAPIYRQEVEGDFINKILALRNQLNDDLTFKELLLQMSEINFTAVENINYPLETIPYELDMTFPENEFPLFDIAVLLQNIHDKSYIAHLNLNFIFSFLRTDEYVEGTIEFNASLYKRETIEKIIAHFTKLMQRALDDIDRKIADISIMSEQEYKQLVMDFNETGSGYPAETPIHELFQLQVEKKPDNTALIYGETCLTYRELNKRANQLGRLLKDKGIKTETIVGILLERTIEMVIGILAVLKSGGAYLPIDSEYPSERIKYFLEDSHTKLLLTTADLVGKVEFEGTIINPEDRELYRGDGSNLEPLNHSGSLAYVIYTSGTTGKPKGVMIDHHAVVNYVWWAAKTYVRNKKVNFPLYSSISFDLTVTSLFTPLVTGNTIVVYGGEERELLIEKVIRENKIDIIKLTPSHLYVIKYSSIKQSDIKCFIVGGEELETQIAREINDIYESRIEIYNEYGPTETTVGSIFYKFDPVKDNRKAVPIGTPTDNARVYILDRSRKPVPVGVKGEIYIAGDSVARGYLNTPGLTAEKFVSNPFAEDQRMYMTGDLARGLPDQNIEFLGRTDRQVKIRGYRIELGEIEGQLLKHEDINEVIVIAKQPVEGSGHGEKHDPYLCAYIISDKELRTSQLREYLLAHLNMPDYMIPSFFVQLEEIPLTSNGKVDRKALPAPERQIEQEYVAPQNEVQERLVEIWSDVLRVEKETISINANFFELGGQSLKQVVMIPRIHQEFNVKIPFAEIFNAPSIRRLSEYIEKAVKVQHASIEAVEEKEHYALSSAQKRLFILDQFEDIGTSYNISFFHKMFGKPDKGLFKNAFKAIIEKHETLRMSFELIDNEPVQRVHENVYFEIEEIQISNNDIKKENIQKIIDEFIRPFDLTKPPLLHVGFASFSEEEHLLLFDIHHIIADGHTMKVLVDDFKSAYDGEELAPLKIQYKDFSTWQNQLIEAGKIKKQEEYWLNLYSDEIPKLNLPTDYPRPTVFTFIGDHYEFKLDHEDAIRFRELCLEYETTLFMNLLAALHTLLYKYSGQTDIIIGSGLMGRPHVDLQNIIGMFVNVLPMRNQLEDEMTYLEFLKKVKETTVEAFENQDVQFEDLVDKLSLARDSSRSPLFDVSLVVQNYERSERAMEESDLVMVPCNYENKTSKFDITLFVEEQGEEIHFIFEYCTSLFKRETIERFSVHFLNIIGQLNENPAVLPKEIDMLTDREKQLLLGDFNKTATEFPEEKKIHELFDQQVEKTPDNIAVVFEDEYLTYGELEKKANQLANYLQHEQNVGPDEPVAILMGSSLGLIEAILGILKAGGAYVPLNPRLPEERIKRMIDDASIEVVVSQKKYIKTLNRLQWECRFFQTFLCMDSTDVYAEEEAEKSELMDKKLWEYVGETAVDEITGGGWVSSYTGEPLSKDEMNEYAENILKKLTSILHQEMRVLEIGCASGITMYRLAPKVNFYYGTDLSGVIIEKNRNRVKEEGYRNIELKCLAAHEIGNIEEEKFDLVIMNSVIQAFHGHNYLRKVIKKSIDLLGKKGHLFIGDVMDQELKMDLIRDLTDFRSSSRDKKYKTKTDFSEELFISREFFEDMEEEISEISNIEFSPKIYTIENELTKFRYDVLIAIDKTKKSSKKRGCKHKYQESRRVIEKYSTQKPTYLANVNNLAYIIYTSGTTGNPKGILIEHKNLVNYIYWRIKEYRFTSTDVTLQLISPAFDGFGANFYPGIFSGGKVVLVNLEERLDQDYIRNVILDEKVTNFSIVPSLYRGILDDAQKVFFNTLRFVVLAGEKAENILIILSQKMNSEITLINEYGPTENAVATTAYFGMTPENLSIIGKPIANNELFILERNRKLTPIGVPGELYISGQGLARGYLNKPELTIEKFSENSNGSKGRLYGTGDRARWLLDGNLEFLGRVDDQVKIRGYRIELGEIENRLLSYYDIKEAVVIARENIVGNSNESEMGEKYLCSYIVPDRHHEDDQSTGEKKIDVSELREFLSKSLPDYMIPSYFVQMEEIPLTVNGKVNRKALPAPEAGIAGEGYLAPENEIERKLLEIWSEVLGIEKEYIGTDADFFELGGHSLKATTMVSKIHKEFDAKVSLTVVFKTPTIRGLSEYIKEAAEEKFTFLEPAEEKEYYALSSAQKRLYILQQMDVESTVYNMPQVMLLGEELGVEKMEEIFRKLINRHESLRTSFHLVAHEPVQKIHHQDHVTFEIEYFDLTNAPVEVEVNGIIENFIRPFDLSQAALLRVGLIHTPAFDHPSQEGISGDEHILMVDMHHIISDGVSHQILVKDFIAFQEGEELPPLRIQYKDFSQWQNIEKEKENLKQQEAYWQKEYEGEIPVLSLPTDYPRPAVQSFDGSTLSFEIDVCVKDALQEYAQREGVTLYMVLLAVTAIFLAKLSGQRDIIIGTPVAGRRHAELEKVIGMFVNTLALRHYPEDDKTFISFLQEVKEQTLQAFQNQDYPFDQLVEKVAGNWDKNRNPLFDVMFSLNTLIEASSERRERAGKPSPESQLYSEFKYERQPSKFDLSVDITVLENLHVTFEYSIKLFKRETIELFAKCFKEILSTVTAAENKDMQLKDIRVKHDFEDVVSEVSTQELVDIEF